MYTHAITERNFYNIYNIYIYICTHFNFLIYGISMEIIMRKQHLNIYEYIIYHI